MELWVLFGSFVFLLLIGTPVAFCLGIASFATVLYLGLPPVIVFQRLNSGVSVFALMAIPFFIYSGDLMVRGDIARRLVGLAGALVGHFKGGLGQVNIVASVMFGGVSGSAAADASAVGGLMVPQMRARGYGADYSVNITVTAALIALLIPPSQNMIIYSIAGGGKDLDRRPVHRRHHPRFHPGAVADGRRPISWRRTAAIPPRNFPASVPSASIFFNALPGLLLVAIIFGGVRSGIFTATESSNIAVVYAVLVTSLVYRTLSFKDFVEATLGAVRTTAMVLLVIGSANAFGWLLAYLQVPAAIDRHAADDLEQSDRHPDADQRHAAGPRHVHGHGAADRHHDADLPAGGQAFGIDPVQFGVILILNLGIGLCTPPVGTVLFVGCAVGKIPIQDAMRSIWPFYLAAFVALMIVTYIPAASLWLPSLFH